MVSHVKKEVWTLKDLEDELVEIEYWPNPVRYVTGRVNRATPRCIAVVNSENDSRVFIDWKDVIDIKVQVMECRPIVVALNGVHTHG